MKKYKEYNITEKQYRLLIQFRDEFEKFSNENYWPPEFIDTPEWDEIIKMAKHILKVFNYDFKLPKEIPSNFKIKLSARQIGLRYVHPENKHTYFRVMPAKYNSLYQAQ